MLRNKFMQQSSLKIAERMFYLAKLRPEFYERLMYYYILKAVIAGE